jgi:small subunit ribosomal protein S14
MRSRGADGHRDRVKGQQSERKPNMATTAKIAKELKPPKFKIRLRNRCRLCGRPRAYMRKFALCRLCFRKLALEGDITGVTKSSW